MGYLCWSEVVPGRNVLAKVEWFARNSSAKRTHLYFNNLFI
jgi:hypothetical protein